MNAERRTASAERRTRGKAPSSLFGVVPAARFAQCSEFDLSVRFYSGHRYASYPRAAVLDGCEAPIEAILHSEVREDHATRRRSYRYVCLVSGEIWDIVRWDDDTVTCQRLRPANSVQVSKEE